jgi:hypothetical protein
MQFAAYYNFLKRYDISTGEIFQAFLCHFLPYRMIVVAEFLKNPWDPWFKLSKIVVKNPKSGQNNQN